MTSQTVLTRAAVVMGSVSQVSACVRRVGWELTVLRLTQLLVSVSPGVVVTGGWSTGLDSVCVTRDGPEQTAVSSSVVSTVVSMVTVRT